MPTPNMKGKEMIYWIKIATEDKRLATEVQRFLENSPKFIELRVPSALVSARTELESYRVFPLRDSASQGQRVQPRDESISSGEPSTDRKILAQSRASPGSRQNKDDEPIQENELMRLEIILRRTLPEASGKQTQTPYG
jgi:hypothetical protein